MERPGQNLKRVRERFAESGPYGMMVRNQREGERSDVVNIAP